MGWDGSARETETSRREERRGEKRGRRGARFFLMLLALWGTVVEDSGSHSEGKKGDAIGRLVRRGLRTSDRCGVKRGLYICSILYTTHRLRICFIDYSRGGYNGVVGVYASNFGVKCIYCPQQPPKMFCVHYMLYLHDICNLCEAYAL